MKCPRKHLVNSHKTKHLRKSLLYPFTVTCTGHQNLLLIINSILFQLRHYLLVVPLVRLVQPWPSKLVNKILGHYLPKRYARDTPEAEVPQSASKGPEAAMVLASVLFSLPAASKSGTEIYVHCYPGTPKKLYVINPRGYYLKITSRCGYKRAKEQNRLLAQRNALLVWTARLLLTMELLLHRTSVSCVSLVLLINDLILKHDLDTIRLCETNVFLPLNEASPPHYTNST